MTDPNLYTVGWICALHNEFVAALEMLDETHDKLSHQPQNDNNVYGLGRVHNHNVVIAVLPEGGHGTTAATSVAQDMLRTFTNLKIGLMVGIGGGAPSRKHDIRLGDIVVSVPRNSYGGVIQYDYGKTIQNQGFHITSVLAPPPPLLLAAVTSIRAKHARAPEGPQIHEKIEKILQNKRRLRRRFARPDDVEDVLYDSDFTHPSSEITCAKSCSSNTSRIKQRSKRTEDDDNPAIHYGLIGSANTLMKDAKIRDYLANEKEIMCFEMEAAGLMNTYPCLVIRGICDYSDTHKNDIWQNYAAMTAAVYTKELLKEIAPTQLDTLTSVDLEDIKKKRPPTRGCAKATSRVSKGAGHE
ncbi:hypothetical protein TWF694_006657 [Orbilia ellipsospora]|uniref:Nucleoside phosphorylase domain-containing protein n=1 Tax=Orbilia ellipsospora TaxID=2528407 RepID=A0AAV9XNC7_9PEZI